MLLKWMRQVLYNIHSLWVVFHFDGFPSSICTDAFRIATDLLYARQGMTQSKEIIKKREKETRHALCCVFFSLSLSFLYAYIYIKSIYTSITWVRASI